MVRSVHKFDFRLGNEISNRWRQQKEGSTVAENYMFGTVCMFSSPTVVTSVNGTLAELKVKCMHLSKGQYTEWPQKMYTLFTHQYLWNNFK